MMKSFLKAAVVAALFVGLAGAASAQVTVSGGIAVSSMEVKGITGFDSDVGLGANLFVDYLLPISVPLSLGFELGFDTASVSANSQKVTGNVIPLLIRAAYHFDLMANLDLYVVGKIGYAVGFADTPVGTEDGFGGVGFGFDVGAAYYFNSRIGVFAEAGYERYGIEKKENGYTIETPFSRFIIIGISAKF
jgi:opacity protein-like surface antigen